MNPASFAVVLIFLFAINRPSDAQCGCGCCDGGCCGCCDCCGYGPTIQIQLPQNQTQSSSTGLSIQENSNSTKSGGSGQQSGGGGSSNSTMNDQIPKMVAQIIAQDILGKINAKSPEQQQPKSGEQQAVSGEGDDGKKSRPKTKPKGSTRHSREAVWPMGGGFAAGLIWPLPGLYLYNSRLYQHQQPQLNEQQLEQKFQQVLFLQQRPLQPLQAEPPPLEPPQFPVPATEEAAPPPAQKMGPLRVIHVKPTTVGTIRMLEGEFEFENHDLKHPFEEPFQ